jgi:hypothetical protein
MGQMQKHYMYVTTGATILTENCRCKAALNLQSTSLLTGTEKDRSGTPGESASIRAKAWACSARLQFASAVNMRQFAMTWWINRDSLRLVDHSYDKM